MREGLVLQPAKGTSPFGTPFYFFRIIEKNI